MAGLWHCFSNIIQMFVGSAGVILVEVTPSW